MVKYLNNETKKSLNELIDYIKNTEDYIRVITIKKELDENKELKKMIDEVRSAQKNYVRSQLNQKQKKELDDKLELLNNNKLFVLYTYHLDKVNNMLKEIKEELNDYFYKITNII